MTHDPDHLLSQTEAAEYLHVSTATIRRYERIEILQRADTPRPGAWYTVRSLDALTREQPSQCPAS